MYRAALPCQIKSLSDSLRSRARSRSNVIRLESRRVVFHDQIPSLNIRTSASRGFDSMKAGWAPGEKRSNPLGLLQDRRIGAIGRCLLRSAARVVTDHTGRIGAKSTLTGCTDRNWGCCHRVSVRKAITAAARTRRARQHRLAVVESEGISALRAAAQNRVD